MNQEVVASSLSFQDMGLAEPFLKSIETLGYVAPTPVQQSVIPAAMQGGDWIVSSQTGSGKTAAFLLPTLQAIWEAHRSGRKNPANAPFTLVLCPTRELAQQVCVDAINLVRNAPGIRIASVVGGTAYGKQLAGLKGASLVVATPGRLLDWLERGAVDLFRLHTLVLDEADRMLDMGFMDDMTAIAEYAENRQQTLMFSATFSRKETQLAQALMQAPQHITLATAQEKHAGITQHLQWADNPVHQQQLLLHWLAEEGLDQALVFAPTQLETDRLADELVSQGISAAALHGAMPQVVRNRRLDALRRGRTRILVATDVAARGIDVSTITHVFNYGLPMKAEDYVHRIGRTGRAGKAGTAVTFAQRSDAYKVRQIERYINNKITVTTVPGMEPKSSSDDVSRSRSKPTGRRSVRQQDTGARKARTPGDHGRAYPSAGSDWRGEKRRPEASATRTGRSERRPTPSEGTPSRGGDFPSGGRTYRAGHALSGKPSREGQRKFKS